MKFDLSQIRTGAVRTPNRIVIHGVGGVGKTSIAAQFPKPVFLMSKGETGLEKLLEVQRLESVAHFPEIDTWENMLAALKVLATEDHDYETLVMDTGPGFERQLHDYICAKEFNGNWGEHGFGAYGSGLKSARPHWRKLLYEQLDYIRKKRNMAIVMLCHTRVRNFKNPEAADYDRYQPDMDEEDWTITYGWCDLVFFMNFRTDVRKMSKNDARLKGEGGQERVLYCQRTAAYDAKARIDMPDEIGLGDSPGEGYAALLAAMEPNQKPQSKQNNREEAELHGQLVGS